LEVSTAHASKTVQAMMGFGERIVILRKKLLWNRFAFFSMIRTGGVMAWIAVRSAEY